MTAVLGLDHDWFPGSVPLNVRLGRNVYIDTTYAFAAFDSEEHDALVMGDQSGAYRLTSFVVGPAGRVTIGEFSIVNGAYIVCENRVDIGARCLVSWGVYITDSWPASDVTAGARRDATVGAARDARRTFPCVGGRPVRIEDEVWVGFGAVIMPGVTLGRGCVIGARAVVNEDVPPYAVVVGDPARIVRYLDPPGTVR